MTVMQNKKAFLLSKLAGEVNRGIIVVLYLINLDYSMQERVYIV